VNIEVAKIAKSANVPIILDVGGMEGPIPDDLLKSITILSPNEIELAHLMEYQSIWSALKWTSRPYLKISIVLCRIMMLLIQRVFSVSTDIKI